MKPLQEHLNDQLERSKSYSGPHWQYLRGGLLSESKHDLEIADLVALAWSLRAAPQLRVNPHFSRQMERRMRRYCAERQLRTDGQKRLFFFLWHCQRFADWFFQFQAEVTRAVCRFLSRGDPSWLRKPHADQHSSNRHGSD